MCADVGWSSMKMLVAQVRMIWAPGPLAVHVPNWPICTEVLARRPGRLQRILGREDDPRPRAFVTLSRPA